MQAVWPIGRGETRGQNYRAAELGLSWLRQLKMPTRRENGIYSAELGLLVGSELAASWLRNEFQLYSALSWHLVGITAVT